MIFKRLNRTDPEQVFIVVLANEGSALVQNQTVQWEVASASVIEPRAESFPCLRCGAHTRADSHESVGEAERAVKLVCRACGAQRTLYFRSAPPLLN